MGEGTKAGRGSGIEWKEDRSDCKVALGQERSEEWSGSLDWTYALYQLFLSSLAGWMRAVKKHAKGVRIGESSGPGHGQKSSLSLTGSCG